ncbi:MAG TPA: hypothetical protein VGW38_11125 [Chloroflexota bacterium]|nr:hypothetical protein [Chloroflexota bacterium]
MISRVTSPRITRRSVVAAGVGAASALTLAACGAGRAGAGEATSKALTQPAKLLWQIKSSATYKQLADGAIEQFKKKHPNVTIETMGEAATVFK